MVQMAFLIRHLVVILGFSYILFLAALPTTRSIRAADEEDLFDVQQSLGAVDLRVGEELFDVGEGEGFIEGRMNVESTVDYPGTGANNHHDPRTPGRA